MKSGDASFEKASLNYDYKIYWMQNVCGEFNIESIGIWSQFSQFHSVYSFIFFNRNKVKHTVDDGQAGQFYLRGYGDPRRSAINV